MNYRIKSVCVRDIKKERNFVFDPEIQWVSDPEAILKDPEIDLIVETVGGVDLAKTVVFDSLKAGKMVVTANKTLIANHLKEIENLLNQNPKARFGFDAAVCGGIPIIHALGQDFRGDNVSQISGIINGTTNFILSKMEAEGVAYQTVLSEAQKLGYAEADPTYDVEGYDARDKILIMARLGLGLEAHISDIYCQGITRISDADFAYAHLLKSTIKLLGVVQQGKGGVHIFVSPMIVPQSHHLANIKGATNAVSVKSEFVSESFFVGPGAGRFPTANSVVSDILNLLRGGGEMPFPGVVDSEILSDIDGKFYIRFRVHDDLGIVERIGNACSKNGVSVDSILQLPIDHRADLPFVLTTDQTTFKSAKAVCDEIESQSFCKGSSLLLPILDL